MTLWSGASVMTLALIFWLNAIMTATPYIAHLSGLQQSSTLKKGSTTALVLFTASILYFFLQVGSFAGEGVTEIFDAMYIQFVWTGPVGQFVQLQAMAAVVWLVYSVTAYSSIKWVLYALVIALMSWSFLTMGHSSDAAWWAKLAILTHLLVAWFWFGSLSSLRNLATSVPVSKAKVIMENFGAHMSVAVLALLVAGVVMYRSATGYWAPKLPLSAYDIVLLTKLGFVALILVFAAVHKFKFVPQLNNELAAKRLKKSITVEMVLAVIIFILASALSSAFSPS